jgi:hypothetical protein
MSPPPWFPQLEHALALSRMGLSAENRAAIIERHVMP